MVDSTRGKYIIGFTVHEAKNLSKSGSSVDPLVVVRAGGNEYKTSMKRDKVDQAKFEESFIWSDVWFTTSEFNMSFIEFELQGACIFTRNEVIGTGKVQLAMVRKRPNHTYNFKTLNLTHPQGTNSRLKVSVFCYTEGDEPPRPEEEGNDDDVAAQMEDLGAAVIGMDNAGASVFQQAYHLFVHIHRAVELGGGRETFNPYVQLEFNSHTVALPVAKKSHSLSSDECFRVPVVTPLFADSILIRIWDKKEWGADDIIIQGRLSFSLLRMHAMQPKWFNFYGFDKSEVTDIQAITGMGEAAEANAYMGRLLISGRVQKVSSESELMRPGLVKGNIVDEPPTSSVTFAVDVFEIAGCPGSSVYVSVALGRQRRKTEPVERDNPDEDRSKPGRFCYKGGKGRIDTWTVVIPSEPGNQLDMLVSVWADLGRGHQRVGFKRVKVADIKTWDSSHGVPIWIGMRPMAHLPTSIIPGSILIGLFQSPSVIKTRPKMEVKPLNFTLRSYCIMARDLNTMKADHLPNPILGISCRGRTTETQCVRSTTIPIWNEVLEIPVVLQCTINNMKVHPEPIQVVVYDEEDETSLSSAVNGLKAAMGLEDSKPAHKGKKGELASQGSKKTKNTGKTVDVTDIAKEIGGGLLQGMTDAIGEMRGDVMAAKRRAEVIDGRRVIGRTQVQLRKIVRPDDASKGKVDLSKKLKWVKLLGGRMGNHQVGDILVAFELMKTKYVKDIPKKSLSPTTKECTLSVALLGLRQVVFDQGEDTKMKPQVVIQGPSSAEMPSSESLKSITWSKKVEGPAKNLGIENDSNKRWCYSGVAGYEFLNVVHLTVNVPRLPLYEPSITFRLYDEKEDILDGEALCEGRFSLADPMIDAKNWVVFGARSKNWKDLDKRFRMDASAKSKAAVVAKDEFKESDDEGADNGIQVSDAEEEGEEKEYIEVRVVKGSVGVSFNGDDETSFPPIVISVTKDSEASKAGVKKGDWLVGYKGPDDATFKLTGMWKPSQAQGWVESMDEDVVRPLGLKFRRKHRLEVTSYFTEEANQYNKGCGLEINQDPSITPPQIVDDISDRKTWKKLGVEPGWYVVDVNGVDLMDLPGSDSKVQKLLKLRPCCITCRPFGKSGQGEEQRMKALADDKSFQRKKEVMLDGMPSRMHSEIEHMLRHTHGELRNRGIPLPRAVIPPVTDAQHLNQHVNRSCLMDVRGIIKRMAVRNNDDDDDDLARPSVTCRLEQTMAPSTFHSVKLMKGNQAKGIVKMAFKLVHPPNPEWVRKIKSKEDDDVKLFEEVFFREHYKHKQPQLLRVRSYIIRGLNVSGAGSAGYGNPYLYFNTGESFTNLQGHRQMGAVEPRFFRTEETDIYLPEQSFFEIGLMDYQGSGTDETIGYTQIDLEERWYSKDFQAFMKTNNVPVEYRPLINKSNLSKGSLEMWLEVLDSQDAAEIPVNVLYQPPPTEVEVRVIVWGVKDVSHKLCIDDVGEEREKIDIMMRCQLECRSYVGPHPKEQESDIHRSATNEGEYNWRFVYPRVQVTKGVPLDCILELSLWETFAVARPMPLCETRIDMKNYCKRVSLQRTMVQIEDDLPMTNAKHAAKMEEEAEDTLAIGANTNEGGEEDGSDEDENPEAGIIQHKTAPPAATLKCTVQVISQVEAAMADVKAGLGRNDPNQFPALTFPKSGRSWQATLPTAAAAIEAVVEAANTGKNRCKIMMMIIMIALPIFLVHYIKGSNGCPLIQKSCKSSSVCEGCARCYNTLLDDSTFCFYSFLQSADAVCGSTKKDKCNIKGSACSCAAPGSCVVEKDCIRNPKEFTR